MKFITDLFKKKDLEKEDDSIPDPDSLKLLKKDELKMIQGIIGLSETQVHEIMKPRIDVVAVDINDSIQEIVDTIVTCGHSRLPVYDDSIDTIVGVLYAKDLLTFYFDSDKKFNLKDLLRKPFFVPEAKRISDLLREFKEKKIHIAVVVDEYGGLSGIVCLEDILEEIVGEIRDEYDHEKELIHKIDDSTYRIFAKTSIGDINDILDIDLPDDVSDSLGGFVMELIGRIPEQNEKVDYKNYTLTVESMKSYKIEHILLKIDKENKDEH